jgi:hypothetical protein
MLPPGRGDHEPGGWIQSTRYAQVVSQPTIPITPLQRVVEPPSGARTRLERQARLLAWGGIAWHFIEFLIALIAGIAAGSIALIGFGADSLIEAIRKVARAGGVRGAATPDRTNFHMLRSRRRASR